MSGFVIFALVLTFVYVVYFAVMITLTFAASEFFRKLLMYRAVLLLP